MHHFGEKIVFRNWYLRRWHLSFLPDSSAPPAPFLSGSLLQLHYESQLSQLCNGRGRGNQSLPLKHKEGKLWVRLNAMKVTPCRSCSAFDALLWICTSCEGWLRRHKRVLAGLRKPRILEEEEETGVIFGSTVAEKALKSLTSAHNLQYHFKKNAPLQVQVLHL